MPQPSYISAVNSFDANIGYGFDLPLTGGGPNTVHRSHSCGGEESRMHHIGARFDTPRIILQLNCVVNAARALQIPQQP
ncbi:MAG: hypothetical protein F4082_07495 [Gammaproteobacteria bacterium]|nr:hypothetical protein [Gammaproteobacteria bacterium]